jgi:hypothetical protein
MEAAREENRVIFEVGAYCTPESPGPPKTDFLNQPPDPGIGLRDGSLSGRWNALGLAASTGSIWEGKVIDYSWINA